MSFELAYSLGITPGKEVVFVKSDDWHRKVRVEISEVNASENSISFKGRSLGSSYQPIKASKKDEPPVPVSGVFTRDGERWYGDLNPA